MAAVHDRPLLIALAANFVFYGAAVTLIGATVPEIIREFGWSYLATGAVMAAGSAGYLGSCFAGGVLIRRLGPRRILAGSLLLQVAGLAVFGSYSALEFNLAAILLVGLGQGGTEVATNYCVVQVEKTGESRLMNLIHAGFTVGASLGPAGVGALLARGVDWRLPYQLLAALLLLLAGALSWLSFPLPAVPGPVSSRAALRQLARDPLLVLLALVVFLYVGSEIGVSSWIAEYCIRTFGASTATGAYMVSVIWLGLLVGRLALSAGYRGRRQAPLLFGLTCLAAASLNLALLAPSLWTAGGLFLLSGLGLSAVYPVVMVLVGNCFREEQSLAIGLVSAAGGIGSLCFPAAMAAIADRSSIQQGFWGCALMALAMMGVAGATLWQARRRAPAQLCENSTSCSP